MPIDPRRMALTPDGRTADRLADLERQAAANDRGVPWRGSSKMFTDSDHLAVGTTMVQGTEFEVTVPANAWLGIYVQSRVTNPNAGGSSVTGFYGPTFAGLMRPLIEANAGGGARSWYSAPGIQGGANFPGGVVLIDEPRFLISSQPQTITLGFGYQQVNAGSAIDFTNNRMSIFFL